VCDAAGAGEPPTDVAGGTVAVVGTAGEGGGPSGALAAGVVFETEDIGAAAAAPAPHATPSAAIVAVTTRADGRHRSGIIGTMSLNDHGALLVERLMTHIVHPHEQDVRVMRSFPAAAVGEVRATKRALPLA
jgi:hypothetical protein